MNVNRNVMIGAAVIAVLVVGYFVFMRGDVTPLQQEQPAATEPAKPTTQ